MTENEKKRFRLTVGEGDEKIEIGEAEIDILPTGTRIANIVIDNAQIIGEIGVNGPMHIRGIMPAENWKDNI